MKIMPIFIPIIFALVMLFFGAGCPAISQAHRADEANQSLKISGGDEAADINLACDSEEKGSINYNAPDGAVGVARYYAKRYSGRKTSSGEIHRSKTMTAAHPSIPLGTRVKVINLANNKSVIVRINDRCREYEEPFIDLSLEAARKLGIIRKGKANVRMIILEDDDFASDYPAAGEKNH